MSECLPDTAYFPSLKQFFCKDKHFFRKLQTISLKVYFFTPHSFANVTAGWTVAADQRSDIKSNDLQIAKLSGTSFAMAHKMGLAILDMTTGKSVPTSVTWTFNKSDGTYTESGNTSSDAHTTIKPYHGFNTTLASGYSVPLNAATNGTNCYYVVKATSASTNTQVKFGCNTTSTKEYWTDITISDIGYGLTKQTVVKSNRTFANLTAVFSCVGTGQTISLPWYGEYKMECWGARGGRDLDTETAQGGYVSGVISLSKIDLFVYVGHKGYDTAVESDRNKGYWEAQKLGVNWGGLSTGGTQGGGSTDIRVIGGNWNNNTSLANRIIVAGGGGGTENGNGTNCKGGAAGGLRGYASGGGHYEGASQSTGYGMGLAEYSWENMIVFNSYYNNTDVSGTAYTWGGGGNGYYAGYSAHIQSGGGGGSSYISGHPGCASISGYTFSSTKMIDGNGKLWTTSTQTTGGSTEQMPNPSGGYYSSGVGHSSDGYAKITSL